MKSKFFTLNTKDFIKGFFTAVIMAILAGVYTAINNNQFPTTWEDWKPILIIGLGSGISYIIKNLVTNSDDQLLKPENNANNQQQG